MRFKLGIFVWILVLICDCRVERQTVRLLQDGEVRENRGSVVDGNDLFKEEGLSETNASVPGTNN